MKSKKGFTLVELSLSIVFIAILSITIALIINDAISTYRRGLTLNQINTVGMDLVDDIRTAIQNSPAGSPKDKCTNYEGDFKKNCEEDNGDKLMSVVKADEVDGAVTPVFGAFCTGAYSYIWNSGYLFLDDSGIEKATYAVYDGENKIETKNFRLLKVEDHQRAVCGSILPSKYDNEVITKSEFQGKDKEPVVVLANDDANPLALYSLFSAKPAVDTLDSSAFYAVSFILGTVRGGVNVMSTGNFCATPEGFSSAENFDYCAINKFNFAAQANGRK